MSIRFSFISYVSSSTTVFSRNTLVSFSNVYKLWRIGFDLALSSLRMDILCVCSACRLRCKYINYLSLIVFFDARAGPARCTCRVPTVQRQQNVAGIRVCNANNSFKAVSQDTQGGECNCVRTVLYTPIFYFTNTYANLRTYTHKCVHTSTQTLIHTHNYS